MQRKKKLVARVYYDPTTHRVEVIRFENTSYRPNMEKVKEGIYKLLPQ